MVDGGANSRSLHDFTFLVRRPSIRRQHSPSTARVVHVLRRNCSALLLASPHRTAPPLPHVQSPVLSSASGQSSIILRMLASRTRGRTRAQRTCCTYRRSTIYPPAPCRTGYSDSSCFVAFRCLSTRSCVGLDKIVGNFVTESSTCLWWLFLDLAGSLKNSYRITGKSSRIKSIATHSLSSPLD